MAKTYGNIAHCYNLKGEYEEAAKASSLVIEAKQDLHRPYIRLCFSYRRPGKLCLALLVLLKGMDVPDDGSNTKTSFVKELAGLSEETMAEVKQYIHQEAVGKVKDTDIKLATGAWYGEVPSGPRGKTKGLGLSSLQNG